MPSKWITEGTMKKSFSSRGSISSEIAALKIFPYLCMYTESTQRKLAASSQQPQQANVMKLITRGLARRTYDEIGDDIGLSRKLISAGLRKLEDCSLIVKEGTIRKPVYLLKGNLDFGWAKLPRRDLLKVNNRVEAFIGFKNRYAYERDALKLYLYILAIRNNNLTYSEVSKGKIEEKTGITIERINEAVTFLQGAGLFAKVDDLGFVLNRLLPTERDRLHRYYVVGGQRLATR